MRISLRTGLTLVEVLISMFLLGAALIPIFDLISKGAQTSQTNEEEIIAASLAMELVDQIATIPYKYLPLISERMLTNEDNGAYLLDLRGPRREFNPTLLLLSHLPKGYERVLTIDNFTNRPNGLLKKVTVTISWGSFPHRIFTISSLVEWRP